MIECWLDAVEEYLRANLGDGYGAKNIGIQPDGHPPQVMADRYISLDGGSIVSGEKLTLKEIYSVNVWLTIRTSVAPQDRKSTLYRGHLKSLSDMERKVISRIHGRQAVRLLANGFLGVDGVAGADGAYGDAFQHPLWYTGRGQGRYEGADWIGSPASTNDSLMVRMLTFQGGLRVQSLDNQA